MILNTHIIKSNSWVNTTDRTVQFQFSNKRTAHLLIQHTQRMYLYQVLISTIKIIMMLHNCICNIIRWLYRLLTSMIFELMHLNTKKKYVHTSVSTWNKVTHLHFHFEENRAFEISICKKHTHSFILLLLLFSNWARVFGDCI